MTTTTTSSFTILDRAARFRRPLRSPSSSIQQRGPKIDDDFGGRFWCSHHRRRDVHSMINTSGTQLRRDLDLGLATTRRAGRKTRSLNFGAPWCELRTANRELSQWKNLQTAMRESPPTLRPPMEP